jgi:hypothetical protein
VTRIHVYAFCAYCGEKLRKASTVPYHLGCDRSRCRECKRLLPVGSHKRREFCDGCWVERNREAARRSVARKKRVAVDHVPEKARNNWRTA